MLIYEGAQAFPHFKTEKILSRLKALNSDFKSIKANYIYLLDSVAPLSEYKQWIVDQLLNLDDNHGGSSQADEDAISRWVLPRFGTISSWSSKAINIFHLCGCTEIKRVERAVRWQIKLSSKSPDFDNGILSRLIFDPMIESIVSVQAELGQLFNAVSPVKLIIIDLLNGGLAALQEANKTYAFALSEDEQQYFLQHFVALGRNPTDVELMMFAQVNSEHCRHKIFNSDWKIDNKIQSNSLFSMIRKTHQLNGQGTLVAYNDNAAVLEGGEAHKWMVGESSVYAYQKEQTHITVKVETHNHPTAISPYPGAATGSGGEIRDESATGRGGKPKAGLVGYTVSHLRIPDFQKQWESMVECPSHIASPLQIMLEAPIGAAAFNNEFGRPSISGYFRNFEFCDYQNQTNFGYLKPIMLAGGIGTIRPQHVRKKDIPDGTPIIVLGGPSMLIGLGGGTASSVTSGSRSTSLDFSSVQRGNPEMQRRCQEVIDSCCALNQNNPIISIHDVGAGGLCNAIPELMHDSDKGGVFELRNILNDEPGMSPMQIWCNESQERYVLAVEEEKLVEFESICRRERCLFSVVGWATDEQRLVLNDEYFYRKGSDTNPIDLPMDFLFGLPPKMLKDVQTSNKNFVDLNFSELSLDQAAEEVLSFPAVADKAFLITIGDRSVGGLVVRDQMVGPWQIPVADVGVTLSGYRENIGEAMAIGERTPLAVLNAPASGRMAVAEAVTNIAAAPISSISDIKLSANWMVAAGETGQDADLYETVKAVTLYFCCQAGIAIPVGKDSMSMKTQWFDQHTSQEKKVISPLSLIVSAFSPVADVTKTLTPQLKMLDGDNDLWLIDLGAGRNRMGGSVLAQCTRQMGRTTPDIEDANQLVNFFNLVQKANRQDLLIAYHDRSDGGLFVTLCEMAFASRCGLDIDLSVLNGKPLDILFNEELGAVVQVCSDHQQKFDALIAEFGLNGQVHRIGKAIDDDALCFKHQRQIIFHKARSDCHRYWSQTSWKMQQLRDNEICANQEYARITDKNDSGLFCDLTFDLQATEKSVLENFNIATEKPRIAILREQGVNGQLEMAAAFDYVGFECVDVTTTDLLSGKTLDDFKGLAACGGFSFGDVLGAGQGWAKSILFNPCLKEVFMRFFHRSDSFALGVCNGCQMLASIKETIPGAEHWPTFVGNYSEQHEARYVMVEVCDEKSILMHGMSGSKIPVSTSHGQGRAKFACAEDMQYLKVQQQIALRYVDYAGQATEAYPYNPNGSPEGMTGFTSEDGRITIMMPHPERTFRAVASSWRPDEWQHFNPIIKLFHNAYQWVS